MVAHFPAWRRSRWWAILSAAILVGFLALCVPGCRRTILTALGRLLVVEPAPLKSADIIVIAIDADGAGTLEAADLVRQGTSRRVAVFDDPPSAEDREFLRRGLPYEDWAAISTRQLRMLGVQLVAQIPRSTSGSEQEGDILPEWCEKNGYHTVVLVTSPDHSRRLSRIFRRSVRNRSLHVLIVSSPYSGFAPDTWWKSRGGTRTGIVELEKLLLDFVRHPFS